LANTPNYIALVEWTGQAIIYPDKAKLPAHLSATFEHLNLQQEHWLNQVQSYAINYFRFVGCIEKLKDKTKALGQQWLKGVNQIQKLYLSDD
jgi:hypothetical protein